LNEFLKELSTKKFAKEIPEFFHLAYKDDEGDEITITNDDDFLTWSEQALDFPLLFSQAQQDQDSLTFFKEETLLSKLD
jgi:hypothetical protein